MLFDRQARDSVEAELRSDESLLWFGRPNPIRVALEAYPFLLFGIPAAIISAWLTAQWVEGPMSHLLTAIPADTIGMGLTLLVFWILTIAAISVPLVRYLTARSAIYALTSERILSVRLGRPTQSFEWENIEQAAYREFKDATGDITITLRRNSINAEDDRTIKIIGIPRIRSIERLLISSAAMPTPEA